MKRGILFFLVLFVTACPSEDRRTREVQSSSTAVQQVPTQPSVPYPADEAAFVEAVKSMGQAHRDAPNELKKSAIRTQRKAALSLALSGKRQFTGWVGRLVAMKTTSDGKAHVSIRVAQKIHLKTWNNDLSDIGDKTLIEQTSPLFASIAELKENDIVRIDGELLPSKQDFVKETSLTEEGSMTDPEFLVRFSSIRN